MKLRPAFERLRPTLLVLGAVLVHLVFWGWNLAFVSFVLLDASWLFWPIAEAAWHGQVPWDFAIDVALIFALPVVAIAGGVALRKDAWRLLLWFQGVEVPLWFVLLFRLFLVREMTPGVAQIAATFLAGVVALGVGLFVKPVRAAPSVALLAGHALLLLAGLYVAGLFSFVAAPLGIDVVTWVVEGAWHVLTTPSEWTLPSLPDLPTSLAALSAAITLCLGLVVFCGAWALLLALPFGFGGAVLVAVRRVFADVRDRHGFAVAWGTTAATLALSCVSFASLDRQAQPAVFAALETPPADDAARRALVARSDEIRAGLLNGYLGQYRYWEGTDEPYELVRGLWKDAVGEHGGDVAEDAWEVYAGPFLYDGNVERDADRAAKDWADFFDEPLQQGATADVRHAVSATWDRDTAVAGLMDVDQARVHVDRQDVSVTQTGDVASVRLDLALSNRTWTDQEGLIYVSLPETAAVTGLWLSDDASDPTRYAAVLAPRGAAQQVYKEQIRVHRDPALLEQVGPRQYRLRAYPVRAMTADGAPPLTVRVEYTVLADDQGVPLPVLLERRNVFWDDQTVRTVDGADVPATSEPFPSHVGAAAEPETHTAEVAGWRVTAEPISRGPKAVPTGRRYAVVVDGSRSMAAHEDEVAQAFAWMKKSLFAYDDVDVYVVSGKNGPATKRIDDPATFEPRDVLWYGGMDAQTLLAGFAAAAGGDAYDATLVLTDQGTSALANGTVARRYFRPEPLWMVHVGGRVPSSYDDATLESIHHTGGGAATSVPEVLANLALWEIEGPRSEIADGYRFTASPLPSSLVAIAPAPGPGPAPAVPVGAGGLAGPAPALPADAGGLAGPDFSSIAARVAIDAMSRESVGQLADLDALHAVAVGGHVVTRYSSLIALVDDWQKARLAQLEGQDDRFDREAEDGADQFEGGITGATTVSAVPEPEEAALAAVALLAAVAWRRSRARSSAA